MPSNIAVGVYVYFLALVDRAESHRYNEQKKYDESEIRFDKVLERKLIDCCGGTRSLRIRLLTHVHAARISRGGKQVRACGAVAQI